MSESLPVSPARRIAIYVPSSHWDREWYLPFQDFRWRLVHLLDGVLGAFADGSARGPFTMDGQAVPLLDYLEIRPEREEEIRRLLADGRLVAGPWFDLPDEWLVAGESLLRNLEMGHEVVRSLGGEPSKAGWVCDLFGHISQLPQILEGFGVRAVLLWRGLEPREHAELWWEGADGTCLPCFRFGHVGYVDYAASVRGNLGADRTFDRPAAIERTVRFLEKEASRAAAPGILIFDGGDHLEPDARYQEVLFSPEVAERTGFEIRHGTLDDYLALLVQASGQIRGKVSGELREVGARPWGEDQQWLIPGILSSRVWIKQQNAECEALLCDWAEPLACLAHLAAGTAYPAGFLRTAWRWLLLNHPHDSICGCSVDETHADMPYRFAQARQIGRRVADESLRALALAIAPPPADGELRVVVANPLPSGFDEPVEIVLPIPADWPCFNEFFGFEPKPAFRLFDAGGDEIPYQRIGQAMNRTGKRLSAFHFPESYRTNEVTICARLKLPPLGCAALLLRREPTLPSPYPPHDWPSPVRHAGAPPLVTGPASMENEFLAVAISPDGTLSLSDKQSGQTYRGLLAMEDVADIGDGWFHGQAVQDERFTSLGCRPEIAVLADGDLLARFRIRFAMGVPEEFDFSCMRRSDRRAELGVEHTLTLRAGARHLEVRTRVDNRARDHRLRVLFPTGATCGHYWADTPFDVIRRAVGLPGGWHLGREIPVETTPQLQWTAACDEERGLAVVAPSLRETAVQDLPDRPIALTLFRSTRRTVLTDGEPGGQLEGMMDFDYWLAPVKEGFGRRRLFDLARQCASGVRSLALSAADFESVHEAPGEPRSFFALDGPAVLTSARIVSDHIELRVFNPEEIPVTSTIRPGAGHRPHSWARVDLEHRVISGQETGDIVLDLRAKEIATIRLAFGN